MLCRCASEMLLHHPKAKVVYRRTIKITHLKIPIRNRAMNTMIIKILSLIKERLIIRV